MQAQDAQPVAAVDSVQTIKHGLRLGVDISKPLRAVLDDDYTGITLTADYRLTSKIYISAEVGREELSRDTPSLTYTSSGTYFLAGADYNFYTNWAGEDNMLYGGFYVGYSSLEQTLDSFQIATQSPILNPDRIEEPLTSEDLSLVYVHLRLGFKYEVLPNFYMGLHVGVSRSVSETVPDEYANLYAPGFGRTYDFSKFGVGYGYVLSYRIPLYKSTRSISKD